MAKTSIIKETRDILKEAVPEAKKHWGDPPDGQVPVNDSGWYTSPNLQSNKGVDPRDCEQWPSSPYCGGNPWSKTPVGLEVDWGVGKCGAWVEVEPILGFTKLPPVSVGWRPPGECREEEKPKEPPPDPENIDESRPVDPLDMPDTIPDNATVFALIIQSYNYYQVYDSPEVSNNPGSTIQQINEAVGDTLYPIVDAKVPSYFPVNGVQVEVPAIAIGNSVKTFSTKINRRNEQSANQITKSAKAWLSSDQAPPNIPNFKRYTARKLNNKYIITQLYATNEGDFNQRGGVLVYGKYGDIKADWKGFVVDSTILFNYGFTIVKIKEEYKIGYISFPRIDRHPPPPDNIKKKKCCMQCCSGGNQQANKQDQDNAEILRLLRKIDKKLGIFPYKAELFDADDNKVGIQRKTVSVPTVAEASNLAIKELQRTLKAIGIDHFPIYSPSSVIQDESNGLLGDLGDLKNKLFKQKIDSLAEFLVWRAKNDNEIFGQWQEVIEIQDSDPNVKGNQPKRVVLPNMAKTLREIILLLSVLIKSQGFSMDALLKMYIDVANTKVSASVSEAILRDIQDYLDYPTVTKPLDVPMGITIPKDNDPTDDKEDVERFLKNSIIKAMFDDWTGEGSLHDMMLVLLDSASRNIQKPHT